MSASIQSVGNLVRYSNELCGGPYRHHLRSSLAHAGPKTLPTQSALIPQNTFLFSPSLTKVLFPLSQKKNKNKNKSHNFSQPLPEPCHFAFTIPGERTTQKKSSSPNMCRMVLFSGKCIRCGAYYNVPELQQSISCLEAKNNGGFGDCRRGVNYDQHDPGLECGPCSAALGTGGGNGDELVALNVGGSSSSRGSSSSSSGAGRGAGSRHDATKRRRVR